jgi:hypothetical protein
MTRKPMYRASSGPVVQPGLPQLSPYGATSKQAPDSSGLYRSQSAVKPVISDNVPVWFESINWRNSFKSRLSASKMLEQIKNYCEKKAILDIYVDTQKFQILGRHFCDHEMAEFMVRIFKLVGSDHSNASTLVQITRLHGSHIAFDDFYVNIINNMHENALVTFPKMKNCLNCLLMPSFDLLESNEVETSSKLDFLIEILEMIENGFRQEAQTAASTLAQESTQPEIIQILNKIPNVTERLIAICFQSVDVLMVRCLLVTLMNGLFKTYNNKNVETTLHHIKNRWSSTQKIFNCKVQILQSREITSKVDQLLNACA